MKLYKNYLLVDSNDNIVYAGVTINPHKRMIGHETRCNVPGGHGYDYPLYQHIRANGGMKNVEMVVLSSTDNRKKALQKEKRLIKLIAPVGNVQHNRGKKK